MRTMKTKVVAIIMAVAMVFALGMTSMAATKGYNQLSEGDTLNAGDKIQNDVSYNGVTLTIVDGSSSSERNIGYYQSYTIPSGKVATVTAKRSTGHGGNKKYYMTISLATPAPGPTPETVTIDFEQITVDKTLNEGDSITNMNHNSPVVVTVTTDGTESTVNINRNGSYTIPAGYTAEVTSKTNNRYSHDYRLSITLTAIPEGDGEEHLTPEQRRALSIDAFVENMYIDVLGRQFDADGRIEFIVALNDNEMTGGDVVRAMFNSEEYAARNQTDEEFIATLCQVMAHRAPTDAEIATWTTALASGTTRAQVVDAFLATEEFATVCAFFQVNV